MSQPIMIFEDASSDNPILLRGGTILTLDAGATVLREADLLIRNGRIFSLGVPEPPPGARIIDVAGCLVLPGLIQGHLHLGQTFFRGLAEGRRLLAWLRERIWPLEAAHDDESAYWCGMLGPRNACLVGRPRSRTSASGRESAGFCAPSPMRGSARSPASA